MTRSRVLAAVFAAAATVSLQAQAPQYRARLSVVPIDVPQQSTIAGVGAATAVLKGSTLTITGSIALTTPQIDDRAASRLYIQLHSQKAPDGNLWGGLFATERK